MSRAARAAADKALVEVIDATADAIVQLRVELSVLEARISGIELRMEKRLGIEPTVISKEQAAKQYQQEFERSRRRSEDEAVDRALRKYAQK